MKTFTRILLPEKVYIFATHKENEKTSFYNQYIIRYAQNLKLHIENVVNQKNV